MQAPSSFTVTFCGAALATAIVCGTDRLVAARNSLASDYRSGIAELTLTAAALPREMEIAGKELAAVWRRTSSRIALEAGTLKSRLQPKPSRQ
jgi:hypothetical protein